VRKHWPRWIKTSIYKHFKSQLDPLYIYFEGAERLQDDHERAEVRIDGPHLTELSKGYWQIEVVVDILVLVKMGNDLYSIDRVVGNVLAAFQESISILQYGDGPDDDPGTMLGCLLLCPDDKESIIVTNFGQPNINSKMLQQTVEAKYRMNLTT
jgi:hypothetical protein